jgi:triosephosphate isomerase
MLADSGAVAVIVGHSERLQYHRESDTEVNAKARAAWRAGLTAIVCIGETKDESESEKTLDVVHQQTQNSLPDRANAKNLVVAYEPVWAIGTGLTPTPADVAAVHGFIRRHLETRYGAAGKAIRILYGGSVKPSNAGEIMAIEGVDGALVGGASLKAVDFLAIIAACR